MASKRHEVTVDTLLADLEEDRRLAHGTQQSGAAVQATMAKARLCGLVVDRKESGSPGEFQGLQSAAEVLALVQRELGDDAARVLAALMTPATPHQSADSADSMPEPASGTVN